jgi:hypothetical protein
MEAGRVRTDSTEAPNSFDSSHTKPSHSTSAGHPYRRYRAARQSLGHPTTATAVPSDFTSVSTVGADRSTRGTDASPRPLPCAGA